MRKSHRRTAKILRIDISARHKESVSRRLADHMTETMRQHGGDIEIVRRDLTTTSLHFLDGPWIESTFTAPERRSVAQRAVLSLSDQLVQELVEADILVLAVPLYNFSIPAALKAWIDLVARAGVTFRYTAAGPEGLLKAKRAFLLVASGGVEVGSEADFASAYLRHVLGFLGISDVTVIAADRLALRGDAALDQARKQIEAAVGESGVARAAAAPAA